MAGLLQKFKELWNPPEEEYGDYDYVEETPEQEDTTAPRQTARETRSEPAAARRESTYSTRRSQDGKVVNLNTKTQLQVVLFKPEQFGEEVSAIADELLRTNTVVLNLEGTAKDVSRRIIDFLSGVAYANGGKFKRVATNTFIITPYNVDLMGDDVMSDLDTNGVYV